MAAAGGAVMSRDVSAARSSHGAARAGLVVAAVGAERKGPKKAHGPLGRRSHGDCWRRLARFYGEHHENLPQNSP